MDFPFYALTEYFIKQNNIDISKDYKICEIPARDLIKWNRFDLMAKWLFIQDKEKGLIDGCGRRVYFDNINAFSCGKFFEPGTDEKNSYDKYLEELECLIADIKQNGFDSRKSLIPVGENDDLVDGSHRVSVVSFYNKNISVIRFPELKRVYSYDYRFFRKYLMSDVSMGYMAIQYAKLKRNCFMACLWPRVDLSQTDKVEEIIRSIGNIIYSQDVYLTYQGMSNFMIQVYGHQAWTGSIENHFAGVKGKVDACYRPGQPVRTYLFEADSLEEVVDAKKRIREIFQIENHSIHISDDWQETLDMTEMLYNRNSVEFMNRAMPYVYSKVYKKLIELKQFIENNGYDKSRFIVDSSAVLEVCGLRQAADLDFLSDYALETKGQIEGVDNHLSQLPYYNISLKDMLYNPENYFYFEGMKFISIPRLIEMKNNRGEEKDIRDVKLLKGFLDKKLDIPKKYRHKTIDRIHNYQIEHQVYGQGQWTYSQYMEHIKQERWKIVKALLVKPYRFMYFAYRYVTNSDFRFSKQRQWYIDFQRRRLKNSDVTIISSNCNGGVISSDLGMQFRSPFINLFIKASDYVKILSDLKGYLDEELRFVKELDPIYGDVPYPTAYLRDAKIYFMHYASEDEARNAWNRRKKRINWDNLYVIFTDRSGCTMQDLKDFDALPYEHKIVFTHVPHPEIKCSYYIKGYENEEKVGIMSEWQDTRKPIKKVYNQFDFVGWFNGDVY